MSIKKFLLITALSSMFIFPEYVFTGLFVILIVAIMLLFIVEIGLDIYIVFAFLRQWLKEKRSESS